jgi:hypothetical protein
MSSAEDVTWGLKHTASLLTPEELERAAREPPPRDPALPPPGSAAGFLRIHLARIAGHLEDALPSFKGPTPLLLISQLRERLAFERTSSRLYAGLIVKVHAHGAYPGGPTPERLVELHNQELEHLNVVRESLHRLGTGAPSLSVAGDGTDAQLQELLQAVDDPSASLQDALRAVLVAEIINNAGWLLLVELAQELGPQDQAETFREVLRAESLHLEEVSGWIAHLQDADAPASEVRASSA